MYKFDFSVIIPQKDSLDSLPRLLNSIPASERIQVIIVDNSQTPIYKSDISSDKPFELFHSESSRFAGGARNVGIEHAEGKWLIFADADDFFTADAFNIFYSHFDSEADLIYFKVDSVYDDDITKKSDRHLMFNEYIERFQNKETSELSCKLAYVVPWGKMVRRSLVIEHQIEFDEVLAANDVMFSTKAGYYAEKFIADSRQVYIITTRKASLANRVDLPVVRSRFKTAIRRNLFIREKKIKNQEGSIMVFLYQSSKFGPKIFCEFLYEAIKNKQNLFIGMHNWLKTYKSIKANKKTNEKYISK